MKINVKPATAALPLTAVYRAISATLRIRLHNTEPMYAAWEQGQPLVLACWHNKLFSFPMLGRHIPQQWVSIVSASKDGEFLAQVLERLGIKASRGSSSRGGVRALMGAVRIMKKEGRQGFVTVDGPRGPRHEPKEGIFLMAQRAGALIVPAHVTYSHKYVFEKAWDKFELPYPFSSCDFHFGTPYQLQAEKLTADALSAEKARLKEKLNALG